MKEKVTLIYNSRCGYILYQKDDLVIGTILAYYDDIEDIIDFDDGLLTVKMKKDNEDIEEYVDFRHALSLLYMAKQSKDYFNGVTVSDLVLEREN